MPYIRPIESDDISMDSINIEHGNLFINTSTNQLFYDTARYNRISLSSIQTIDTEEERKILNNVIEGKVYIVLENARPYIYRNGLWVSLTVAKSETYSLFFVDPVNGDNVNNGLNINSPVATIDNIFDKYPDFGAYLIKLSSATYNIDGLIIQNKFQVSLIGDSGTDLVGDITFSAVSNVQIKNCTITDLTIKDNSAAYIENSHIYENGIVANNHSGIQISSSTIADSVESGDNYGLFTALNGSSIVIDGCSGSSTSRPLYHAAHGSSIHVSKDTNMSTNYDVIYNTTGTGKIYFEADSTDASTKEYIDQTMADAVTSANSYTETQIEAVDKKVATNTDAIDAINNADTGIAAVSKAYTDDQIASVFTIEEVY